MPVRLPQGLLIQIPLHQRHQQRRDQSHQGHRQPAQGSFDGSHLDGARRTDAVRRGSQRKPRASASRTPQRRRIHSPKILPKIPTQNTTTDVTGTMPPSGPETDTAMGTVTDLGLSS